MESVDARAYSGGRRGCRTETAILAAIINVDPRPDFADTSAITYVDRITIDPARRSGKPCVRDTRITVYDVLDYLASGMSHAEILADFPELDESDIRACLAFAADRERRLLGAA